MNSIKNSNVFLDVESKLDEDGDYFAKDLVRLGSVFSWLDCAVNSDFRAVFQVRNCDAVINLLSR